MATPVGTPPNLIGIGFIRREVGVDLSFFQWMALGMPVVAILFTWSIANLWRGGAVQQGSLAGVARLIAAERGAQGAWTAGQRNTIIAFGVTVFLWVFPGVIALVSGQDDPFYKQLVATFPEGVVAILGAALLFVSHQHSDATSSRSRAAGGGQDRWWIVFLYARRHRARLACLQDGTRRGDRSGA